jgi:hypothetical protein
MVSCCKHGKKDTKCHRKDKKTFKLPRRFTKNKCKDQRGFTMRSSCAPYKYCNQKGGRKKKTVMLPRLRPLTNYKKKHKYKLKDPFKTRILALNEGVNYEFKQKKKTKKQAAISKKGRLNILRIYRRNNNIRDCKRITRDMRYLDKQYKLGKTKQICKKQTGGRKKTIKKQTFLYHPNNPDKSFDVYIDKNPSDTIPIKYTTINDVKKTIKKLERLYKQNKYTHKRIWQVGMIMRVRLKVLKDKKPREYKLAERYFQHLKKRTQIKGKNNRKKYKFII